MRLADLYHSRLQGIGAGHADIIEHLPTLARLASDATHITEFGVRTGNSTIAFLNGLAFGLGGDLYSYDVHAPQFAASDLPESVRWHFTRADTSRLADIAPTDILFLDTLHTAAQLAAELVHADRVRRYLVFHDTMMPHCGEESGDAVCDGVFQFLATATGARWRVYRHYPNNNGLLILCRR